MGKGPKQGKKSNGHHSSKSRYLDKGGNGQHPFKIKAKDSSAGRISDTKDQVASLPTSSSLSKKELRHLEKLRQNGVKKMEKQMLQEIKAGQTQHDTKHKREGEKIPRKKDDRFGTDHKKSDSRGGKRDERSDEKMRDDKDGRSEHESKRNKRKKSKSKKSKNRAGSNDGTETKHGQDLRLKQLDSSPQKINIKVEPLDEGGCLNDKSDDSENARSDNKSSVSDDELPDLDDLLKKSGHKDSVKPRVKKAELSSGDDDSENDKSPKKQSTTSNATPSPEPSLKHKTKSDKSAESPRSKKDTEQKGVAGKDDDHRSSSASVISRPKIRSERSSATAPESVQNIQTDGKTKTFASDAADDTIVDNASAKTETALDTKVPPSPASREQRDDKGRLTFSTSAFEKESSSEKEENSQTSNKKMDKVAKRPKMPKFKGIFAQQGAAWKERIRLAENSLKKITQASEEFTKRYLRKEVEGSLDVDSEVEDQSQLDTASKALKDEEISSLSNDTPCAPPKLNPSQRMALTLGAKMNPAAFQTPAPKVTEKQDPLMVDTIAKLQAVVPEELIQKTVAQLNGNGGVKNTPNGKKRKRLTEISGSEPEVDDKKAKYHANDPAVFLKATLEHFQHLQHSGQRHHNDASSISKLMSDFSARLVRLEEQAQSKTN